MTDRAATVEYLKAELTKLFPGRGVRVVTRTIIGAEHIHVLYTHNTDKSQCVSGILENDRAYMHFTLWDDRAGSYIEFPTVHCGRVFDDGTVKFRKLKGKTEREAAEKLVAWFAKNRAHILKVGAEA